MNEDYYNCYVIVWLNSLRMCYKTWKGLVKQTSNFKLQTHSYSFLSIQMFYYDPMLFIFLFAFIKTKFFW
jgi:hypothetical protein